MGSVLFVFVGGTTSERGSKSAILSGFSNTVDGQNPFRTTVNTEKQWFRTVSKVVQDFTYPKPQSERETERASRYPHFSVKVWLQASFLAELPCWIFIGSLEQIHPRWFQVDGVGWLCALAYGVLIPACLLGLMVKQHVALRASRTTTALAILDGDQLLIRVLDFLSSHMVPWTLSSFLESRVGFVHIAIV